MSALLFFRGFSPQPVSQAKRVVKRGVANIFVKAYEQLPLSERGCLPL